ncbi:MAG: hypothetical protein HOI80_04705 [Alphaproteobacteria bacterium]|nr:hypothetical protein [Alphaproteobacteria bacterium]MBT5390236.1 hypothetical protein [Alphaproteobacteria bacterium]MBT5654780.1 hypothetical protein [Alphaproteobacteria bacterium]
MNKTFLSVFCFFFYYSTLGLNIQPCGAFPDGRMHNSSQEEFTEKALAKVQILRNHLLSKNFSSLEDGVQRLLNIRSARDDLIALDSDEGSWKQLYDSLQSLTFGEENMWPTQSSYEKACKANLLLRAVLGDEKLLKYLEYTVANRFEDADFIKRMFSNLFWTNPLLLERGYVETLRIAGDNKRGPDGSITQEVYGNSLALWLYYMGTLDRDQTRKELTKKVKVLTINLRSSSLSNACSGLQEEILEQFQFLDSPTFTSEQEEYWKARESHTLESELTQDTLHAGIFLGQSIASPNRNLNSIDDKIFLKAVEAFVREGQNGNPQGWFYAYYYNQRLATYFRETPQQEKYLTRLKPYMLMLFLTEGVKHLRGINVNVALFRNNGIESRI